jgi:hypothetical protein
MASSFGTLKLLIANVVNQFHLDVIVIQPLYATHGGIPAEVITRIRIAVTESCPHLVRLIVTGEGDLIVGVIVIGAHLALDCLFLTPLQCAVIFHTLSI